MMINDKLVYQWLPKANDCFMTKKQKEQYTAS